jgi:hypothetical protein
MSDEHARWAAYQAAVDRPEEAPALLAAVAEEPDPNLAVSVVLAMLERVPDEAHDEWVGALAPDNRARAERRSREVRVLRRAESLSPAEVAAGLSKWTDWLQLRLAPHLPAHARTVLAEHGRTRRIRNAAAGPREPA